MSSTSSNRSQAFTVGCVLLLSLVWCGNGWAGVEFKWLSCGRNGNLCPDEADLRSSDGSSGPRLEWRPTYADSGYSRAGVRLCDVSDLMCGEVQGIELRAPAGAELLPGKYRAGKVTSTETGKLDLSGDLGCDFADDIGFTVVDIVRNVYGIPVRFVAEFSMRCDVHPKGRGQRRDSGILRGRVEYRGEGTLGPTLFGRGNLLLMFHGPAGSVGNLYELTREGETVQTVPLVRRPGGPPEPSRIPLRNFPAGNVVVDGGGRVHVLIGVGQRAGWPLLATFEPTSGHWTYREIVSDEERKNPGRGTAPTTQARSLAAFGPYVFTIEYVRSSRTMRVMRWDTSDGYTVQRFAESLNNKGGYFDLTAGLDGNLYLLRWARAIVDVYDPETLDLKRSITLSRKCRGIAVNAEGEIFGYDISGRIYRFDNDGALQDELHTELDVYEGSSPKRLSFSELALSRDGVIMLGVWHLTADAPVMIVATDERLDHFQLINPFPGSKIDLESGVFLTFVEPPLGHSSSTRAAVPDRGERAGRHARSDPFQGRR